MSVAETSIDGSAEGRSLGEKVAGRSSDGAAMGTILDVVEAGRSLGAVEARIAAGDAELGPSGGRSLVLAAHAEGGRDLC